MIHHYSSLHYWSCLYRLTTWRAQVMKQQDNLFNYMYVRSQLVMHYVMRIHSYALSNYRLFLRITPFVPNFFVNIAAPQVTPFYCILLHCFSRSNCNDVLAGWPAGCVGRWMCLWAYSSLAHSLVLWHHRCYGLRLVSAISHIISHMHGIMTWSTMIWWL